MEVREYSRRDTGRDQGFYASRPFCRREDGLYSEVKIQPRYKTKRESGTDSGRHQTVVYLARLKSSCQRSRDREKQGRHTLSVEIRYK